MSPRRGVVAARAVDRARLPRTLDPGRIAVPGFRHWFRYPLRAEDFRPVRAAAGDPRSRLLGYYAAKPLYGRTDAKTGRVDRDAGLDGGVVALFVPSPARSWRRARLLRTRIPRTEVVRADGRRNWPAIRRAAERAIRRMAAGGVA